MSSRWSASGESTCGRAHRGTRSRSGLPRGPRGEHREQRHRRQRYDLRVLGGFTGHIRSARAEQFRAAPAIVILRQRLRRHRHRAVAGASALVSGPSGSRCDSSEIRREIAAELASLRSVPTSDASPGAAQTRCANARSKPQMASAACTKGGKRLLCHEAWEGFRRAGAGGGVRTAGTA